MEIQFNSKLSTYTSIQSPGDSWILPFRGNDHSNTDILVTSTDRHEKSHGYEAEKLPDVTRIRTGERSHAIDAESTFDGVIDSERYVNTLDVSSVLIPGPLGRVLTPEEPSSSFRQLMDSYNGGHYVCSGSSRNDPAGDAHLIRRVQQVPMKLVKQLMKVLPGKDKRKGTNTVCTASPDFVIGRQNPVKVDALVNKVIEIIQDHPEITPTLGEEHTWSPDAKKHLNFGFFKRLGGFLRKGGDLPMPLFGRSKLFLCLACGWTSQYLPTGKEEALTSKLMDYPDRSLQLHDVFRESYVLNRGNLYETLLTAENVLSDGVYDANRDEKPLQKKLSYIRNDSTPEGDNFGAWYHFMGIGLYGLVRAPMTAKAVGAIEAAGSLFLEGPDRQETFINLRGAEFGSKLRKMMNEESWRHPLTADADTNYMNLTEFGRLEVGS